MGSLSFSRRIGKVTEQGCRDLSFLDISGERILQRQHLVWKVNQVLENHEQGFSNEQVDRLEKLFSELLTTEKASVNQDANQIVQHVGAYCFSYARLSDSRCSFSVQS